MSNSNQEIDLSQVFGTIGKGFQTIISWFQRRIRFVLAHKLYFGIFVSLGILYGIFSFFTKPKEYYSKMTLKSHLLNNQYCLDMIETLGELVDNDDYEGIVNILKIDTIYAKEIAEISFKRYKYNLNPKRDSISDADPFSIQVSVYDNKVLDTLQLAIIRYFENNPFALRRKEIIDSNIKDLSSKINEQIVQLDTLKKTIENNLGAVNKSGGGIMFMQQSIDPINTYREVVNLYERQLAMREKMLLNSSVETIQGFVKFGEPHKPKLLISSIKYALYTFTVGLLLSFFVFKRK